MFINTILYVYITADDDYILVVNLFPTPTVNSWLVVVLGRCQMSPWESKKHTV